MKPRVPQVAISDVKKRALFFRSGEDKEIVSRFAWRWNLPQGSERKKWTGQGQGERAACQSEWRSSPISSADDLHHPQASTYPHPNSRQSRGPPIPVPSSFPDVTSQPTRSGAPATPSASSPPAQIHTLGPHDSCSSDDKR